MTLMRLYLLSLATVVLASCSSKVDEGVTDGKSTEEQKSCEGRACAVCELPWGGSLGPGETTEESYSKSLVECSENCSSFKVKLTCKDGQLVAVQGTQPFLLIASLSRTCHLKRCDCTHAGAIVEDGKTRDYFIKASASCGTKCESRNFTCKSGKLFDTAAPTQPSTIAAYTAAACAEIACKSCTTPWGAMVDHTKTIPSYKTDVAGCNQTCAGNTATLLCTDGTLSGGNLAQYKFGTCTALACQNCTLPSGDILAHNAATPAYRIASAACGAPSCASQSASLTCNDGAITGGDPAIFKFAACTTDVCRTCTMPCGVTLGSGGSYTCYRKNQPSSCGDSCSSDAKLFKCLDGVTSAADSSAMSGNTGYTFTSCSAGAACSSCQLPDGRRVLDRIKSTFFKQKTLGCGQSCLTTANAITLTCSNGEFANQILYADFRETECSVDCRTVIGDQGIGRVNGDGGGAPVVWCQIPWNGQWATHNTEIIAFSVAKPPAGMKCSQYRRRIKCNAYRGLWSGGGTFVYGMCKE